MIQNITGKHAGFLGVFVLGMPNQFNQLGKEHRLKFFIIFPVVLVLFATVFLLGEYLGIGK
jgi:hypothetical protein